MDHDIRQMLLERADDVTAAPVLPAQTAHRATRRRVLTGAGTLVAIAALAIAGLSIAGALVREPVDPIAPSPRVSAKFRIGPDVSDLAYGFGSIWYATDNALLRVDPSTGRVLATIADFPRETSPSSGIGSVTTRLAVGDNAVWLLVADNGAHSGPVATSSPKTTGSGSTRSFSLSVQTELRPAPPGFREHWALIRIDPRTNTPRASALVFDSMPNGISADGDSVWVVGGSFARNAGVPPPRGLVWSFDARTLKARSTFELTVEPSHVLADDGSLWINEPSRAAGQAGRIVRLDPRSGREDASAVLRQPGDLVLVGDELWATTYSETHWAVRGFDRDSLVPSKTVQLGRKPHFSSELVAVGNKLWVIDLFSGTLRSIDPQSGRRTEPVELFLFPAHIADGGGVLWTAGGSTNEGMIWRVELP